MKSIETQKKLGITYYLAGNQIVDVDVMKDIKTVEIDKDINITEESKSFPNVTTLKIGKDVRDIHIPNSLFPNVRKIKSSNRAFPSGSILRKKWNTRLSLLNSFCLREDEVLDLERITDIERHALKMCCAGHVVHTENVGNSNYETFRESQIQTVETGNVKMVGTIVTDVETANGEDMYVIPQNATHIVRNIPFGPECTVVFTKNDTAKLWQDVAINTLPQKICLNGDNPIPERYFKILNDGSWNIRSLTRVPALELSPDSGYCVCDRMIYSLDKKTLYVALQGMEHVSILPGTERIRKGAFSLNEDLKSVEIPDSVTDIEDCVFLGCHNLKNVKFGNQIETIGDSCFGGTALEKIEVPNSVKKIEANAFCGCRSLKSVVLPPNLKQIGRRAFGRCLEANICLTHVELLEEGAFDGVKNITLGTDDIPVDFALAVCTSSKLYSFEKVEVISVKTPSRTLLLPRRVSKTGMKHLNEELNEKGINVNSRTLSRVDTRTRT